MNQPVLAALAQPIGLVFVITRLRHYDWPGFTSFAEV